MLTRSRHNQAHKKLGDLHRRWLQANALLAPAIEFLPQLLILPVVLFVIGLLDNVISSSLPVSGPFTAVFIAGLMSAAFAAAVATYTIWTVFHGCMYPNAFQSTLSQLWVLHETFITYRTKQVFRSALRYWSSWMASLVENGVCPVDQIISTAPCDVCGDTANVRPDVLSLSASDVAALEPHDAEAFHTALQMTHDDDILNQAVTAYTSLTSECVARFRPILLKQDTYAPFYISTLSLAAYEIESLAYTLSDEASIRTNITAAAFIANPLTPSTYTSQYLHIDLSHAQD